MRIYLINLARRPDRWRAMEAQGLKLGLTLTRVDAVDARETAPPPGLFAASGPLGEIPRGDQCCTLSHIKAWTQFLDSGQSQAVVMEDDVLLREDAGAMLKNAGWIPEGVGLVKLEHYGPRHQKVLVSDFRNVGHGLRIARLRSRHTGAAAYILTRPIAEKLLAVTRFNLPVDHLLFNPNNSPLFAALSPWQLLPALARQQDFIGAKSDIESWRVGMRKLTPGYVKREMIRFGYDLKLLPQQLALLASGKAALVRAAG